MARSSPFVRGLARAFPGLYRRLPPTADFDRGAWFDAAMERDRVQRSSSRPPRQGAPANRDWVRRQLRRRNLFRFWQVQHDMKWVRKELVRLGVDPSDAGYYV